MNTDNFRQTKEVRHQPKPECLPAPRLHSTQATRQDVLRHQRRQRRWAKTIIARPQIIGIDVLKWMQTNVADYIDPDVEEVSTTQLGAAAADEFDAYDEPKSGDPYPIPEWIWEMAFVVSNRYEAKEFGHVQAG